MSQQKGFVYVELIVVGGILLAFGVIAVLMLTTNKGQVPGLPIASVESATPTPGIDIGPTQLPTVVPTVPPQVTVVVEPTQTPIPTPISTSPPANTPTPNRVTYREDVDVEEAESQIVFMINYSEYIENVYEFTLIKPDGITVTPADDGINGVSYSKETSYQLYRIVAPSLQEGEWTMIVVGPPDAKPEFNHLVR